MITSKKTKLLSILNWNYENDTIITTVYDANGNLIRGNIFGIELKPEPEEIAKSLDAERHISTLYSYPLNEAIPTEKIINRVELKIFGSSLKDFLVENERQEILEQTDEFILARFFRGNELKEPDEYTSVTQFQRLLQSIIGERNSSFNKPYK